MAGGSRIGLDTIVTRSDEPVAVEVDGTVVMMSIEQGMYFGLEGVGPRIWSLLVARRTVRDLCAALMEEFEIDADSCAREVLAFLEELRDARLLRVHGDATEASGAGAA